MKRQPRPSLQNPAALVLSSSYRDMQNLISMVDPRARRTSRLDKPRVQQRAGRTVTSHFCEAHVTDETRCMPRKRRQEVKMGHDSRSER